MNMHEIAELEVYYKAIFQSGNNPISDALLQTLIDYDLTNEKSKKEKIEKDILPNTGKYHASIMMSKMFALSSKQIFMVLGKFQGEVSDNENYLEGLKKAISKNVKFDIIFLDEDAPNPSSKAYELLLIYKGQFPDNVHFYKASDSAKKILKQSLEINREYHFATFDSETFRTELVPEDFAAVGSYYDAGRVEDLVQIYHEMQEVSTLLN